MIYNRVRRKPLLRDYLNGGFLLTLLYLTPMSHGIDMMKYKVVFLDINMEEVDGLDTASGRSINSG